MPDVNPIRFPSPYLLARDIFQLQSAARQVGIIRAIVGHRTYTIHHINSSDWFTVERNGGGGMGSLLRRGYSSRTQHLEWQMNHLRNHTTVNTSVPHNPPPLPAVSYTQIPTRGFVMSVSLL